MNIFPRVFKSKRSTYSLSKKKRHKTVILESIDLVYPILALNDSLLQSQRKVNKFKKNHVQPIILQTSKIHELACRFITYLFLVKNHFFTKKYDKALSY